jgi:hypothetical protein
MFDQGGRARWTAVLGGTGLHREHDSGSETQCAQCALRNQLHAGDSFAERDRSQVYKPGWGWTDASTDRPVYSYGMTDEPRFAVGISLDPDSVIERYKQDVDVTLLRANLRRTPEERLLNLMALQRFADELQRAGRRARQPR